MILFLFHYKSLSILLYHHLNLLLKIYDKYVKVPHLSKSRYGANLYLDETNICLHRQNI